ncbi:MAG: hypothetical protein HC843_02000 [Sphingomonadales bacterium]|nr:hypothetical protein [Sphingomonadales bacterium]
MKAPFFLLAAAALLSSCSAKIDTRVMSSGVQGPSAAGYIVVPPANLESPAYHQSKALIAKQLSAKGYQAANDGSLYLEVGIAARPASLSLRQSGKLLAEASTKRRAGKCQNQEYRLTVALTRISDGAEIYRGSAGEYHCKQPLEAVLPQLVGAALADLGNPKGDYVNSRWIKHRWFR